jgi:2-dehydro-3-deoxygluconokinase
MGDAFLDLWKAEGHRCLVQCRPPSDGADRRQLRHALRGGAQVRLSAQEFGGFADARPPTLAKAYIAGAKFFHVSAIGQAISARARARPSAMPRWTRPGPPA